MAWSWVDTEYSIHRVQHTPSTAYTEYTIQRVQHTLSTASTQDCLSSLHSHESELTPECRVSFRLASLHDRLSSASSLWELRSKVTLSHSHGCELTNWWIESQHRARRPSTASKYLSNLTRSQPPSVYPNLLDYGLQFRTITASKCISKLAQSQHPIVYPNSLDYGLHVCTITASTCISGFTRSWPPSASLSSLDLGLQVQFSTRSITASKYIVNERRRVHGDTRVTEVNVHSIVIFRCTSNCWQSPRAASPDIPCVDR